MMPDVLHAVLRLAMFIVVASTLLLFWTPAGSAARTITILSLLVGLLLLGVVAGIAVIQRNR